MSIFTCQGGGRIGAPIQIVLSVYENALELLSDFDLAAGGNSVTNKHLNEKRADPKKLFPQGLLCLRLRRREGGLFSFLQLPQKNKLILLPGADDTARCSGVAIWGDCSRRRQGGAIVFQEGVEVPRERLARSSPRVRASENEAIDHERELLPLTEIAGPSPQGDKTARASRRAEGECQGTYAS